MGAKMAQGVPAAEGVVFCLWKQFRCLIVMGEPRGERGMVGDGRRKWVQRVKSYTRCCGRWLPLGVECVALGE